MAKGQSQPQNTTTQTTVQLPKETRELFKLGMPFLRQFAGEPPEVPGSEAIAPFDPLQTQGQEMALTAAGGPLGELTGTGASMARFLSGDVLSPETNPYLASFIDYAVQPIYDKLTQSVLPAIRGEARDAGQFGGSRQGIAEGLAAQGASRAAGGTAADIATRAYGQGLEAYLKNLALLPQTSELQLLPSLVTSGVGDVRQAMAQALLGADVNQGWLTSLMPLLVGQALFGIGSGIPGGTTTSTGQIIYPQSNPLLTGLGGAATGASLGSMFGPVGTAAGAGIGGLLGLFG